MKKTEYLAIVVYSEKTRRFLIESMIKKDSIL